MTTRRSLLIAWMTAVVSALLGSYWWTSRRVEGGGNSGGVLWAAVPLLVAAITIVGAGWMIPENLPATRRRVSRTFTTLVGGVAATVLILFLWVIATEGSA